MLKIQVICLLYLAWQAIKPAVGAFVRSLTYI